MNSQKKPATGDLPKAKIARQNKISLIWLVPLAAAIASGWLVYLNLRQSGPLIMIQFSDGSGLQANQTVLKYHGIVVGKVSSVHLSKDAEHVEVLARLQSSAKVLAQDGTLFWVVRPEVGAGGLSGLETIVSGPFIQAQPENNHANSREQKRFTGLEQPPILTSTDQGGKEFVLTTPEMPTLSIGSPVYYRGVEVGSVRYFVLGDDATKVNVHLMIETNFAPLVRANTMFWNAGGIKVDLKFFRLDISAQNFKSLAIGGIAFATPDAPGPVAQAGSVFLLNEKLDDKWLKWSPPITLTNGRANATVNLRPAVFLNDINSTPKQ